MQRISSCLRWIDEEFLVQEDFVGMHEVDKAHAASLSTILLDVIIRMLRTYVVRAMTGHR